MNLCQYNYEILNHIMYVLQSLHTIVVINMIGTADMTQCGIEAFDAALKSLQIDVSIHLVSSEDEPTKHHELIQPNEGFMENNFFVVKEGQVGYEITV